MAAADILGRFLEIIETTFGPLALAHRARCAAAIRARPAEEIVPLRLLLAPVSAETALLSCSSRNERRLRSCSNCVSAEVRLVMAANCTGYFNFLDWARDWQVPAWRFVP